MIKKIIMSLMLIVTPLAAVEFDTQVGFSGSSYPTSMFYKKTPYMPENMKLAFGFSSTVPFSKSEELDVDLNLGIKTDFPIIGVATAYFTFDNHDGVERTGEYKKSDFYTKSLSLSKTWVHPLTDKIDLGVKAVLGKVLLNGEYQVVVLPSISPVIAMKIDLF